MDIFMIVDWVTTDGIPELAHREQTSFTNLILRGFITENGSHMSQNWHVKKKADFYKYGREYKCMYKVL